jgi:hypothetical protein
MTLEVNYSEYHCQTVVPHISVIAVSSLGGEELAAANLSVKLRYRRSSSHLVSPVSVGDEELAASQSLGKSLPEVSGSNTTSCIG